MTETVTLSDPLFSYLTFQVFSENEKFWSDVSKQKKVQQKLSKFEFQKLDSKEESVILTGLWMLLTYFMKGKKESAKSLSEMTADFKKWVRSFEELKVLFRGELARFEIEKDFLNQITISPVRLKELLTDEKIGLDLLLIAISALPVSELQTLISYVAGFLPEGIEFQIKNTRTHDVKSYLSQTSQQLSDLMPRVKVLLQLSQRREKFIDFLIHEKLKEKLKVISQDTQTLESIREQLLKTLYGQYLPLVKLAKPYIKLLS
jgi:hypothetical protein